MITLDETKISPKKAFSLRWALRRSGAEDQQTISRFYLLIISMHRTILELQLIVAWGLAASSRAALTFQVETVAPEPRLTPPIAGKPLLKAIYSNKTRRHWRTCLFVNWSKSTSIATLLSPISMTRASVHVTCCRIIILTQMELAASVTISTQVSSMVLSRFANPLCKTLELVISISSNRGILSATLAMCFLV